MGKIAAGHDWILLVLALFLCPVLADAGETGRVLDADTIGSLVLEHHPAVVTAASALEQAIYRERATGSWPDPELEARILSDGDGGSNLEGALRFPIPVNGRLAAHRRAAAIETDLARLDFTAAQQVAIAETYRHLARLAWARSLVALHESLALRSTEQAELARQRQQANLADPLEVSLVLADAARDRRALVEHRTQQAAIEAELLLLAGVTWGEAIIETQELTWSTRTLDREAILAQARSFSPALAGATMRLARDKKRVTAAERGRWPGLVLGPALTREGGESAWGVAVGLELPIFGRTRAELDEARAGLLGAESVRDLEQRALPVRVNLLLNRLGALETELAELSGNAASAAEQAFRLARARWTAGTLDVLHLLSAHRAFAEMNIDRLDTLLQLHETWLDLQLAVGRPPAVADPAGPDGD